MHVRELRKGGAISDFPNISLSRKSLKPAAGDSPSPEKTADGYELRSRGPATLGPDALDKILEKLKRLIIWNGGSICYQNQWHQTN